jgi:uncharacterized cupin superfamily protein
MAWKLMLASAVLMAARSMPNLTLDQTGTPALTAGPTGTMQLQPNPIEPSWILNGAPQARLAEHSRSADEACVTAVWDCTAGEFRWFFGWDETVMIMEGDVHVTSEDGHARLLQVGDLAYFKGGTWATWRVDNYVKKVAFVRRPMPAAVTMAYRLRNFLRSKPATGLSA